MSPASAPARLLDSPPLNRPRPTRPAAGRREPLGAGAREAAAAPGQAAAAPRQAAAAPRQLATSWPLLRACRPRQWLKNGVVLIAPASAGALGRPGAAPALLAAFAAFCLMASATYLINDVRDRDGDRRHPRKRLRPIAAGQVSVPTALAAAAGLAVVSLAIALSVSPTLAVVIVGYAALTCSYSLLWREVVFMDVVVIAAGFVFRAAAGAAAVNIPLSRPFLVVTSACALFLIAGKRHAELMGLGQRPAARATLRRYSERGLRLLLLGSAGVACLAYAGWSQSRPTAGPWLGLSLVPFVLWIGRYAARVRDGAGEAPEELILRDTGLAALSVLWSLLFLIGIYGLG
ncbi:MAG: decaprenyl-phosphate phosphoribosyltransferase [Solirubrobacterales bacterium]|nr:decaprenyl-phosphate phosphoribosyltransferase [Solirubrobacterales bacterium]